MIELRNIKKEYTFEDEKIVALDVGYLRIEDGEFVAIMGTSGSGKSTLLNIIGCMDKATYGDYYLDSMLVSDMNANKLADVRASKLSFVFQNFALMDKYTAYENIELPLLNRGEKRAIRKGKVFEAAEQLGIRDQLRKYPKQMSGGQQQRIAIARALVSGADIILADEPTGALDRKTGIEMMNILKKLNEKGKTIIVVTHDNEIAKYANRLLKISDGRIV